MRGNVSVLAFNRGILDIRSLSRIDLNANNRINYGAEIQTNWMPRVFGSMMLRPGTQYLNTTRNNLKSLSIPFIFSTTDTAELELTDGAMRVLVNDTPVSRVAVSTVVLDSGFTDPTLANWSGHDEAGTVSDWETGNFLALTGEGTNMAIRRQTVTVAAGDYNKEHAFTIVVARGTVVFKAGTGTGLDNYIAETSLAVGTHSLAFTPTGNVYVEFSNVLFQKNLVDSIAIAPAGDMVIPTPWTEALLPIVRKAQSADVVFVACKGLQQRRIERRGLHSWSIVKYQPVDGPFRTLNTTTTTLTTTGLGGNITITASRPIFKAGHVGALFQITSDGQRVTDSISTQDTFTSYIKVTGVGAARSFTITRSGTWVGTVTLQRSVGLPGLWEDTLPNYGAYTANGLLVYQDFLDNQIIYYRLGFKTGDYTSGTANLSLDFGIGSITGTAIIHNVISATQAAANVQQTLGNTVATQFWAEGQWSDYRGWPSSVAFYEGRLYWAGNDYINGSLADSYENFNIDQTILGDKAAISRSLSSGPADTINWLLPMQRMIAGSAGAEISIRSTSFDEPLTPANFNFKNATTQGSKNIEAVGVDTMGFFVQRAGTKVYRLDFDLQGQDYKAQNLMTLCPDIAKTGIVKIVIQRQIDTRIHILLADGTVAICVFDPIEQVNCFIKYVTDGIVEDAFILPATEEDAVYYIVKRIIDGNTVRYREKWALESECQGGALNKQADCFKIYNGAATAVMTGLSHLEGKTVTIWANGKDTGTATVTGGQIALPAGTTKAVAGLPYTAQYKSTKLAYLAQAGGPLNQRKQPYQIGFNLVNTHPQGIRYGKDFSNMQNMPLVEDGKNVDVDTIWPVYDKDMMPFDANAEPDARICLQAASPRPCTIAALNFGMEIYER